MLRELDRPSDPGSHAGMLTPQRAIEGIKQRDIVRTGRQSEAANHSWPHPFSSRRGGMYVAGMLGAAGVFFASQALLLDVGGIASPGPGFLPLLLGAFLVLCAALIGIGCWRSAEGEAVELGHRDVLITGAALLMMPLMFERVGAYVALALFGTAILVLIGRIAPLRAIAATMFGLGACWYFFQVLLGVQLPTGPW